MEDALIKYLNFRISSEIIMIGLVVIIILFELFVDDE